MPKTIILVSLSLIILMLGCTGGKLSEVEFLKKANDSLANDQIEDAISFYESLVKYYPESENIEAYKTRLLELAVQAAEEFAGTSRGEIYMTKAITFAGEAGDSLKNWFEFQNAIKLDETDPEKADALFNKISMRGYYQVAQIYLSKSDFKGSIRTYKKLIEVYPDDTTNYKPIFMIGFNYAEYLQNYEEAEIYFQIVLDKYPDCELATSAEFMIENMGKSPDEIEFIIEEDTAVEG